MATEVYTPEPVQGHTMKPDIEIDEDGITWLFIESQYGSFKANHETVTAPPFSDFADPITRNLGFDPGHIDPARVVHSYYAQGFMDPKSGVKFTGNVL
ncbi:hypothetical protein ArV1_074 [Arthrobacter phage vB_ArtM-ArV1]|uniref:Uncharacterized protein n=1 Tax=Arthrobacter phage vB_ArtM-ArV1 TaxID=1566993 RepID=A0A0A7HBW6_9CAUD|nr:hypothetical protein ArV1_074 [Arthrobacter phage vB_ArtM-ArV1]AIZ01761.1 hypothetical protein ArV1_074 [Arthrobacter phage vB_ArtM-ArV1]